jgi:glutamate-1-semialdehyde aminotransferase
MKEMEEIFFSGTFGGELLSLAAAKVVLERHANNEVVPHLISIGNKLREVVNSIITEANLQGTLELSGHPTWTFLNWNGSSQAPEPVLKTYFLQEMLKHGILIFNTHNVSLSITDKDIKSIAEAYSKTLQGISSLISTGDLESALEVQPLTPLFKVR